MEAWEGSRQTHWRTGRPVLGVRGEAKAAEGVNRRRGRRAAAGRGGGVAFDGRSGGAG